MSMSTDGGFWSSLELPRSSGRQQTSLPRITMCGCKEIKSARVPIGNELRCLRRKDLIETLARSIPAEAIRFGCHVAAVHKDTGTRGAVVTSVDDRTVIRAKVLIGCDGTSSVVAKYLGLSAPKSIPRTVLRGFTRYPAHGHPFEPEFLRLRGEGFFLGRLPVTDDVVHFFVTMPTNPPLGAATAEDVNAVRDLGLEKLAGESRPTEVAGVPERGDPDTPPPTPPPPPRQVAFSAFRKGAVTVAGDAMHAMGLFIGQGGSAGLEAPSCSRELLLIASAATAITGRRGRQRSESTSGRGGRGWRSYPWSASSLGR